MNRPSVAFIAIASACIIWVTGRADAMAVGATDGPIAACQTCPDGVTLIVIGVAGPNAGWQADESHSALDIAMSIAPAGKWRASVIAYGDGGASVKASLTGDVGAARAALDDMVFTYSIRAHAREAARLAVLELAAAGSSPCRVVIFYAYTKDHVTTMRAELTGAAAQLRRLAVPMIVVCPMDPTRWYCQGPEPEMATSADRFIVYPESGKVAAAVYNALRDTDRGKPVVPCETLTPTPRPTATPTRTATRTPPRDTPTPTKPTPTEAARATSTMTPTASRWLAYIPITARETCADVRAPVDVGIVIDASSSMLRYTSAGRSKLDAAIEAAGHFVDLLAPGDRAAVAWFNAVAEPAIGLTEDRAATHAALASLGLRVAQGTRLDLAITAGGQLVQASRGRPVVIVLSDGLPNGVPFPPGGRQEDTVLAAATRVKAGGARVFTVSLGADGDVDRVLLAAMASLPGDAYAAVDGEELSAIYRAIASRVTSCQR